MIRITKEKRAKFVTAFYFLARIALGLIFLASALPKIQHPWDFLNSVYAYQLVGPKLGILTAVLVPWFELILGVLLVGGLLTEGALLISAGLLGLFVYVQGSALHRGLTIGCGCFSSSGTTINYSFILRTAAILALALLALILHLRLTRASPSPA